MKYFAILIFLTTASVSKGNGFPGYQIIFIESESDPERYSYCKPDEDPVFSLFRKDEQFYYYEGEKEIRGYLFQQNPESPLLFHTGINQSCKFRITKGFKNRKEYVETEFLTKKAWEKSPECDEKRGDPSLSGEYTIRIKGFRISKNYIDEYDPSRINGTYYMRRYSFSLDFDGIAEVHRPAMVSCPQVVY